MSTPGPVDDSNAIPEYVLWPYTPTIAAGAITAVIMFILFFIHTYRLVRNRTWFCIPFVIGALCEAIGYSARAAAHNDTENKTPYIIQSTLILLAPILFAASIYMILGRLIRRTDSAEYSLIRVNWLTKLFVGGDVLCFMIQGGGAGMLVSASDAAGFKRGENIILGGLILQILIFGFFVVVAGIWHVRLQKGPTAASADIPWTKLIWFLYAASVCITIRNLCRVIEYAMGKDGYLLSHEWPIYVYDFLPMMITLIVCVWWYDPNIKPARKGDIEFARR
ncbi:hypothetical protein J4E83_008929 [Alternaria metachromatica]|uniref:uncharacterized protein n=1 Tax=Alternaria metachromatica TaxID=283354 RepID=UPI0020C36FF0|nr:uncharacterized protein J4E83_008929 [Alternaria metachromatica]KAI4608890.1 hypothetical protein J4E83_008929 [Alternaria metachromatica]KAI4701930.1 hypothetical protein J4E89_010449 [Alternaria sp. Ai002NY15]